MGLIDRLKAEQNAGNPPSAGNKTASTTHNNGTGLIDRLKAESGINNTTHAKTYTGPEITLDYINSYLSDSRRYQSELSERYGRGGLNYANHDKYLDHWEKQRDELDARRQNIENFFAANGNTMGIVGYNDFLESMSATGEFLGGARKSFKSSRDFYAKYNPESMGISNEAYSTWETGIDMLGGMQREGKTAEDWYAKVEADHTAAVEAEKEAEAGEPKGTLSSVPSGLPPLTKAYRVHAKAAGAGFTWDEDEDVERQVEAEWLELLDARASGSEAEKEHELGDMIFTLVELGRRMGVKAASAVDSAANRFRARFEAMENLARERGLDFKELSLDDKDDLWNEVKAAEPAVRNGQAVDFAAPKDVPEA